MTNSTQTPVPVTGSNVEVLVSFDPDDGEETVVRVWLDGAEITTTATFVTLDPRDGPNLDAWDAETEALKGSAAHSAGFNDTVVAVRDALRASDYLKG